MADTDKYKKIITETFPEVKIHKFSPLNKGKSGIIFLANDEIIFKVPLQTHGEIARWQKNEATVLKFLEGKLDIEIPKILYTGTSKCGLYIIAETMLSGTAFSYELCDTYSEETKNNIQRQLGKIVRNLHEAGGNDSSWLDDGYEETLEEIMGEFNERFHGEILNVFSSEEIKKITEIANFYKEITIQHPVKPVLCHHDLHYYNLMFDTKNKCLTGLLDFGCAGYAEPARDWYYYFDTRYVLEGYGDTDDKYFHDRQKFHALSHLLGNLGDEIKENKQYMSLQFIKDYILTGQI